MTDRNTVTETHSLWPVAGCCFALIIIPGLVLVLAVGVVGAAIEWWLN